MQHTTTRRHARPEIRSASIYDGQARLGRVEIERDRFTAISDSGKVIGVYGDLKRAVRAFGETGEGV
jgi:hypothetical protein